jgi:WD40 repeat protein/tRNA A-37 threonylcarbamoyl transferase component Bud32
MMDNAPSTGDVAAAPDFALLLADQRAHWQRGERIPCEAYFLRYPALMDDTEAALDLVGNELLLHLEAGERPSLEEFAYRFPRWSAQLKAQFAVELALEEAGEQTLIPQADESTHIGQPAPLAGASMQGADSSSMPQTVLHIPGYENLGEIARGGQSVVYKARQLSLNRLVALKMILGGAAADMEERARLRREAEAVAQLRHPHIVQIYDIGEQDGLPYLALEFMPGGTLTNTINAGSPRPLEAARLIETLARAIHAAHEQGFVHRDLKPGNILFAADGAAKIADFGLAKRLQADSQLTQSGSIMGTPSYMAPEQAAGKSKEVGPAADVYGLGAILYELLTGRPPFHGQSSWEIVSAVMTADPLAPRRLQVGVPEDLETICLKCLEKAPYRRYSTALALAEDLHRLLQGMPITARPVSVREQVVKWARRRPAVAGLLTAVALVTLIGLGFFIWEWQVAVYHRRQADMSLAAMYTFRGLTAHERGDPSEACLWFALCSQLEQANAESQLANRVRLRTWSRLVPIPLRAFAHDAEVKQLAFHRDGGHLLTVTADSKLALWDIDREERMDWPTIEGVSCAGWTPDGALIAVGTSAGGVEVRDFPGGKLRQTFGIQCDSSGVKALAISANGAWLAASGIVTRVWDLKNEIFATPILEHKAVTLSFNPAGDRLVAACDDDLVRMFSLPGGAELAPKIPHRVLKLKPRYRVAPIVPVFINKGKELLTVLEDDVHVGRWNADTGKAMASIRLNKIGGDSPIILTLAADANRLAIGGYMGARLWDVGKPEPEELPALLEHLNHVTALAINPDGDTLLTASEDRTSRLWSMADGKPKGPALRHLASLRLAAFAPDGRRFVTAQDDGLVRLWAAPQGHPLDKAMPISGMPTSAKLSLDGRYVYCAGGGYWDAEEGLKEMSVFDVATGKPAGKPVAVEGRLINAALFPDGTHALTLCAPWNAARGDRDSSEVKPLGKAGHIQFWNWRTGVEEFPPLPMPSEPRGVDYSPDGRTAAVICQGGLILVLDPARGKELHRLQDEIFPGEQNTWPSVLFTPDNNSLITWGNSNLISVRDVATGNKRFQFEHAKSGSRICYHAALSKDGRYLVTSGWSDKAVRVWDLADGSAAVVLQHPEWVFTSTFNKEGNLVLTACRDGNVRVWNWRTGELAHPPCRHPDAVYFAAFTPDEQFLITACRDGNVRAWERSTARQVAPSFVLGLGRWDWGEPVQAKNREGAPWNAAITPNGDFAVIGGNVKAMYALSLGDLTSIQKPSGPETWLFGDPVAAVELLSGQKIVQGHEVEGLTTKEWLDHWKRFRRLHPEFGKQAPP